MFCVNCGSERIANVTGKVNDCCNIEIDDHKNSGYIPEDMPFGGGDYLEFDVCLNCGIMVGSWPHPMTDLEEQEEDKNDPFYYDSSC